ncbi:MAG: DUF885 domain-containing protein [Clostridiales bacterium]|nr:DUF885 domain-containing protein [Clostridiales bacterium]
MHSKRFPHLIQLLAGALAVAVLVSGCSFVRDGFTDKKKPKQITGATHPTYTADFNDFADQVFAALVSFDQVTLHSMVLDEEKFDIEEAQSSWGDFSNEAEEEDWALLEDLIEVLEEYDYDELSRGQKITYDTLMKFLEGEVALKDAPDFYDPLNSLRGNHLFLAFNLDTYQIDDQDDLDMYMMLVKDIKPYVESICEYEKRRSEDGLFMKKDYAIRVMEDISDMLDSEGTDFISGFEDRVDGFDFLSDEEREEYKEKNREYVDEYVMPAYQLLYDTVEDLKETGEDGYGLARFEGGKEYYARQIQMETGTMMTVDEVFEKIEKVALESHEELFEIAPEVDYDLLDSSFESYSSPDDIIENNLLQMSGRFPEIPDAKDDLYVIDEMPDSIARFAAGMYLLPQVDDPWDNVFYINDGYSDGLDMYEVVSHECIPGHLYQTVWFLTSDNENIPLRYLLSAYGEGLGTEEGWTTYIETISYEMAGLPELETRYVELFYEAMYTWTSLLDIGINYYGWTQEDAEEYFSKNGMDQIFEVSLDVMESVDIMPAMYLSYTVGKIELKEMMARAQETLGDDYSELEFHRFYLETGPCTFEILNREMNEWMKEYN